MPVAHVWHSVSACVRVSGAHVGMGGCKTSQGTQEGEPSETDHSVTTLCLCRLAPNWSSHTSLWYCLFFQAYCYCPISLIPFLLSPSSPSYCCSNLSAFTVVGFELLTTSVQFVLFYIFQAESLYYSWPKIFSFLAFYSPMLWRSERCLCFSSDVLCIVCLSQPPHSHYQWCQHATVTTNDIDHNQQ